MAAKKKPKMDPRASQLRGLREEIKELEAAASSLRTELLKDYGPGVYEGFVILEKTRSNLDKKLLEAKLGDLDPYKTESSAIYIEFL